MEDKSKPTAAKGKRLQLEAQRMTERQVQTMEERDAALAEVVRLRVLAEMVAALEVIRKHGGQEVYLRSDREAIDVERVRDLARKLTGQGSRTGD